MLLTEAMLGLLSAFPIHKWLLRGVAWFLIRQLLHLLIMKMPMNEGLLLEICTFLTTYVYKCSIMTFTG